jgi:hypothetical protein
VGEAYSNGEVRNTQRGSDRAVQGIGLRPLAYCDRVFESHREHECLTVECVVFCPVEVSAKS